METIQSYKCPCCGAPLVFSGGKQKLVCDACNNEYDVETLRQAEEADSAAAADNKYDWDSYTPREFDMKEDWAVYTCPSCGAEVEGDAALGATECPYCGNTTIMKDKFEGGYMPDYIIPFRVEKKNAMSRFLESAKKKILIPKEFKTESRLKKLTGVYVPFWMFDCDADADGTYSAQTVRMWSDRNYNYTQTNFYKLYRSGNASFANIPIDASQKAENAYMDALEPFDYSDAVDFNSAYLSGYLADKYDVSVEDSIERANSRIRSSMDELLKNDTGRFQSVQTQNLSVRFANGKVRYALLPVWMLNVNYKGKLYRFAMNGQTGKSVGNYPVSWGKLFMLAGAVFAITAVLAALIGRLFM